MHTIEIPELNIKKYMPEHLGECDKEQYINMCGLLYKHSKELISFDELKTHAVYYLLGLKKGKELEEEAEDNKLFNLAQLEDLIDSFFEPVPEEDCEHPIQWVIKQYYIHNSINVVTGLFPTKKYYGPSDEFNNLCYGEYVDALGYFADYNDTKDDQYLYLLMGTLYREAKPLIQRICKPYLTDIRREYCKDRVPYLAENLRFLDMGIVYGFYLLFASFQKYLPTAKIFVQGDEIDLGLLYMQIGKKAKEYNAPSLGMESTQFALAESGVFGDLEKLRATPLWEIFKRLYDIRKRDLDALENHKTSENAQD